MRKNDFQSTHKHLRSFHNFTYGPQQYFPSWYQDQFWYLTWDAVSKSLLVHLKKCLLSWKTSFLATQTCFKKFSKSHLWSLVPISNISWVSFGIWWHDVPKLLETLHKWSNNFSFITKLIFNHLKHILRSFQKLFLRVKESFLNC